MINDIFDLTNDTLDNVLFAIDQDEDLFTTRTFVDLSEKIAAHLKLDSKNICHRLFRLYDKNIGIRASLYLERQILNRYRIINSQVQGKFERIERIVIDLKSQSYFDSYAKCLEEGPFDDSLQFNKKNKEGLIWFILAKFKDLQLPLFEEIKGALYDILVQTVDPIECRSEMDSFYHELKIVASR